MQIKKLSLLIVVLAFAVVGCKLVEQSQISAAPTSTYTPSPIPTTEIAPPTRTPESATEGQSATQTVASENQAQQTQAAATQQFQTQEAGSQLTSTAQVFAGATQEAQAFYSVIQRLSDEGVVGSAQGEYHRIGDFDESWAQINYYSYWRTGYDAQDFVISASAAWDSASDKANWPTSGCGFVFSEKDNNNHYLGYLGLDGWARVARVGGGDITWLARNNYGRVSIPAGDARIMLVVFNKKITFYVNDQRVANATGTSITTGPVALTLLSGTNKDFGTRCQMKDINLWIFE